MTSNSTCTIWKDGRAVATATLPRVEILEKEQLELRFFATIKLSPIAVFEHLGGRALGSFLDKCGVETVIGEVTAMHEPLRYVHGRSESMRGTCTISSVLLAKSLAPESPQELVWLASLPSVYTEFLKLKVAP